MLWHVKGFTMLCLVEALNYRSLRYIRQPLNRFHLLVGPNASGKSSFLDAIAFLGRLVRDGLEAAIFERTRNVYDLVWQRSGEGFQLAVEAVIPGDRQRLLPRPYDRIRYEVHIGLCHDSGEWGILAERALLKKAEAKPTSPKRVLFPVEPQPPSTLLTDGSRRKRSVLAKSAKGVDHFYVEVTEEGGKGWFPAIRLGPRKSALANLPEDTAKFPVTSWFRQLLAEGVQIIMLNSLALRNASPPGQPGRYQPDGSNLPWLISDLQKKSPEAYRRWIEHLRTALPELDDIRIVEREEDRHRYLVLRSRGGLEVPSWMVSDGTLRLLALTLLAYLPELKGIYLVEEPENGIHPRAVELVYQSLCSVYEAQVLVATHSPIMLSIADPKHVLCFKKTESGATDIVRGDEHPALHEWRGETNLGMLFAAGILG